jgi:hypothetical protein
MDGITQNKRIGGGSGESERLWEQQVPKHGNKENKVLWDSLDLSIYATLLCPKCSQNIDLIDLRHRTWELTADWGQSQDQAQGAGLHSPHLAAF